LSAQEDMVEDYLSLPISGVQRGGWTGRRSRASKAGGHPKS